MDLRQMALAAFAIAIVGQAACDQRGRKSSGPMLENESAPMGTTNVYRFVGVEQSLADARRAVSDDRWDQAAAAAEALLREQPGHSEAMSISKRARDEAMNLQHYNDFMRSAGLAGEIGAAVKHYNQISETSVYRERARIKHDKLRQTFTDNQESDARALARAGRCDEARRTLRIVVEWFPESRGRLDDVVAGCRPSRDDLLVAKQAERAGATVEREVETLPLPASTMVASAPVAAPASLGEQPREAKAPPPPAHAPILASAAAPASVALPPTASLAMPPRNVPASELDVMRTDSEGVPALPAGARRLAHRDKVSRLTFAVKFCVSESGMPNSISLVKSSDYSDANDKIVADVRRWRFKPYLQNGAPTPVCTAKLLNYQIE